ncbi:MAG: zinc-ribbon domain-containing protein [Candidatus Lokiarchaeota archaeon]|nr:zinc-ribbon domain-containing protein [Candidatus Lokiarchaeota archaeon]
MSCPSCGAKLEVSNQHFCHECGGRLPDFSKSSELAQGSSTSSDDRILAI